MNVFRVLEGSIVLVGDVRNDRNGGRHPRKVGYETKAGDAQLGLGAVKLGDDIRERFRLVDDDHWTEIARLGFPAESILDSGVPEENEGAGLEVEVDDSSSMTLLKLLKTSDLSVGDEVAHALQVIRPFGQLPSPKSDKIFGRHAEVLVGSEVSRLGDVERKERVDAMRHVIWRIACGSSNSNTFSPEDLRNGLSPFGLDTTTSLHDGFADVEMLTFHDAVRLQVISRDPDMIYMVLFGKELNSSDPRGAVVGNELHHASPTAEDVLE